MNILYIGEEIIVFLVIIFQIVQSTLAFIESFDIVKDNYPSLFNNLGDKMSMFCKLYNEEDNEIQKDGISINDNFFSKKEIADVFNYVKLLKNIIEE